VGLSLWSGSDSQLATSKSKQRNPLTSTQNLFKFTKIVSADFTLVTSVFTLEFDYLTMDNPSRRPRKKRRHKPPSGGGSVSSQVTAASMNGSRLMDSRGNVKLEMLPNEYLGKTPDEVAEALLSKPTSSEVVGVVILSSTLKDEYRARCVGDFASKEQQIKSITTHLQQLEDSLGVNTATTLRLHEQSANIQAQLTACYQQNTHLKGQKETVQQELGAIQDDLLVHQTILDLINLTDETNQPRLPFQTLPLKEVEAPIPGSVDVSSNQRSRSSLVAASEEDLIEELRRRKEASSKEASSECVDNNSDGEDNNIN
jgi:hypothetical protein